MTAWASFDAIAAIATAELRGAIRRWRIWLCVGAGVATLFAVYGFYAYAHAELSGGEAAMAYFSPRFAASYGNVYVLWLLLVGLLFLTFDLTHRNRRERIAEVLNARPVSNIGLLSGRLVGVVLAAWLPLAVACGLIQLFGFAAREMGLRFGEPVEPVAEAAFVFVDALPVMALWVATVLFVDATARRRWAVLAALIALLLAQVWSHAAVPAYLAAASSPLAANVGWASDMLPRFLDATTAVQRGANLLLAGALVAFAAVADHRPDGVPPARRLVTGLALAAVGLAAMSWLGIRGEASNRIQDEWLAEHRRATDMAGLPDVQHLKGVVRVLPGDLLSVDVVLEFVLDTSPTADVAFGLNPGMRIEHLRLDGESVSYQHEHGLLTIKYGSVSSGDASHSLALRASGAPDERFAYLDSAVDWRLRPVSNRLGLLGTESMIFDTRYVALMPGADWLPRSGPSVAAPERAPDFFSLDLVVEVPDGWLVAGPGRARRDAERSGRFRFSPGAPVTAVGLFAGPFTRFSTRVRDVDLELLVHPPHGGTFQLFADAGEPLLADLDELLREADGLGLGYPYDGLTVVEVPARLRTYGGGWQMGSAMALPGVLLLRESGFPTARFDLFADRARYEQWEGGVLAAKAWALRAHTYNDRGGGDLLAGFVQHLFGLQTAATGSGASAVDMVTEELAFRVVSGRSDYPNAKTFTAHHFDNSPYFGAPLGELVRSAAGGYIDQLPRLFYPFVDRPSVWELASRIPLAGLAEHVDQRLAAEALLLRGTAVARSTYDGLGRQGAASLLAGIRGENEGTGFDVGVMAAEPELTRLLGDWLGATGMPGFLVSRAEAYRLPDADDGTPRYQLLVHVRNDEPVPGLVRVSTLRWNVARGGTEPVPIDGHEALEIGLVVSTPPNQLWLHSHLSLNRASLRIELPEDVVDAVSEEEPFEGARPSDWQPKSLEGVVIDDLDGGFSLEDEGLGTRLEGGVGGAFRLWEIELDQGIPVWERQRGEWSRRSTPSAWGKYRRTAVQARAGPGSRRVAFAANLPESGRWQLDYHVPNRHLPAPDGYSEDVAITSFGVLGVLDMLIASANVETRIAFDAGAAEVGWNKVGEFDLEDGDVRLVVTNRTDGEVVVADAIRWRRAAVDREP
ncbi:MAG: hypothetical protein OXH15_19725 [Gammaproteobacteria bacterium]|nr:hypothetical protein [Gammaproteobacteria bacterium]